MLHALRMCILLAVTNAALAGNLGVYQEPTPTQIDQASNQAHAQLQTAEVLSAQADYQRELSRNQRTVQNTAIPTSQPIVNVRQEAPDGAGYDVDGMIGSADAQAPTPRTTPLIMVSLSLPGPALQELVAEARRLDITVIYRGLKGDSFRQMRDELARMNGEGEIDPTLFTRFGVTEVPTFILPLEPVPMCNSDSCPVGRHVKVSGMTSLETALEFISRNSREQDAKAIAEKWLAQLRSRT